MKQSACFERVLTACRCTLPTDDVWISGCNDCSDCLVLWSKLPISLGVCYVRSLPKVFSYFSDRTEFLKCWKASFRWDTRVDTTWILRCSSMPKFVAFATHAWSLVVVLSKTTRAPSQKLRYSRVFVNRRNMHTDDTRSPLAAGSRWHSNLIPQEVVLARWLFVWGNFSWRGALSRPHIRHDARSIYWQSYGIEFLYAVSW